MSHKKDILQAVFDSNEARRIQHNAHRQACEDLEQTPRHMLDKGNPNHPMYDNKLFGYAEKEFLSKQYKQS